MRSAKDLAEELDYWIMIGTADDIVRCPGQRREYQHIVKRLQRFGFNQELIPVMVLAALKRESAKPVLFQSTFWHLKKIQFKKLFRR